MYKFFLTLRYLRSRRIAYFAIAAVSLCVAMVLIVMSVMGGWLDQVKKRARGLLGDVIIDNRSSVAGFPLYQEFIDEISAWPEIEAATPVIYTFGLIRFPETDETSTVRIVGIRLDEVVKVNAFGKSLFYERFYPGTTTLAEQQQPLIGADWDAPRIRTETGELAPPPGLPPLYEQALECARQALGISASGWTRLDEDSVDTGLDALLKRYNLPQIPGVYAVNVEGDREPRMAGDPRPGLIIGRDLFARRESDGRYTRPMVYPRGCLVTITLWAASLHGNIDPVPLKQPFRYTDDSRTGIYEIDSMHVYCSFDLLQRLVQMDAARRAEGGGHTPARCSQIQIKVKPTVTGQKLADLTRRMEAVYAGFLDSDRFDLTPDERRLVRGVEALTWEESQAHLIGPVQKEKILVTILFSIISLVAVALILCILYMIVLQKTRDIGIIRSIGGSSTGVAGIFITYGCAVGVVGGALGTLMGALVVWNINEIQDFLISINPAWRVWDLQVYSFDQIPHEVDPVDAVVIALIAVAAATIGSLVAAWRAGNMQPVEALRHE